MKKIFFISVYLLLLQHSCICQNRTMDSLKVKLKNAQHDTTRLRIYLILGAACEKKDKLLYAEPAFRLVDKLLPGAIDKKQRDKILQQEESAYNLALEYYSDNSVVEWDKANAYIKKRLRNIEQTGNKKRIAETLSFIANVDFYRHDTSSYLKNSQKSLAIFKEIKDTANIVSGYFKFYYYYVTIGNLSKSIESVQSAISISRNLNYPEGISLSLTKLGDLYRDNGEDGQALENYRNALSVSQEAKDTNTLFNAMAALGGFHYTRQNPGKALEYYYKLLELHSKTRNSKLDAGYVYKWIGIVYKDNNDYTKALLNFEKSLFLFDSAKNLTETKNALDEIGTVYNKQGDFRKALEYHSRAAEISDSLEWEYGKAWSHYLLALDYYTQKNYKTAGKYNDLALAVLKKHLDVKSISNAELLASRIDSATSNGTGAYNHYKEYIALNNKLKGEEIRKEAQKEKFQTELDLQKASQQRNDEKARRIKNQQYLVIAVLAAIILAVLSIALIQWRNNRQKQKTNLLLRQQKEKLETTLSELKSTQAQLIQSEKMASLGELTAGIAHEIQNPLNFVNNFSEVSNELIDEMKSELATGNGQSAMEIADDIKLNLKKINHHGKRADAIVKGMLQHSRTSSGIKEPTDINALADEYLRLAYHGLRAKDKSFNAKFETDFDNSIGKINVVPQDIGRVMLNLINNAFYAVSEKKKQSGSDYEPTVSIRTRKSNGTIEIRVSDNGNGIPAKLLDKIFQPFFTTKPTGQGTGLGLSLAYDIITKGHGGKLKVETTEEKFTEFIIKLP